MRNTIVVVLVIIAMLIVFAAFHKVVFFSFCTLTTVLVSLTVAVAMGIACVDHFFRLTKASKGVVGKLFSLVLAAGTGYCLLILNDIWLFKIRRSLDYDADAPLVVAICMFVVLSMACLFFRKGEKLVYIVFAVVSGLLVAFLGVFAVTFASPFTVVLFIVWMRWHSRRRYGEVLRAVGRLCASLTRQGMPLVSGLYLLGKDAPRKVRKCIYALVSHLRQGRDLSEAMMMQPRIFPPLYISLIHAGERSGTLPAVLKRLGRVEQFLHSVYASFRMRLVYPLMIVAVFVPLEMFTRFRIRPRFERMFDEFGTSGAPGQTPLISFFIGGYDYLMPLLMIPLWIVTVCLIFLAVISVVTWFYPHFRAHRGIVYWLPFINRTERDMMCAQFANLLAAMVDSGMPTAEALKVSTEIDIERRLSNQLFMMRKQHESGKSLSESFVIAGPWPKEIVDAVKYGETTGHLAANLERAANRLQNRAERRLRWFSQAAVILIIPLLGWYVMEYGGFMFSQLANLMMLIG